jgi:hypothetical protein
LKLADETYRGHGSASLDDASVYDIDLSQIVEVVKLSLKDLDGRWGLRPGAVKDVLPKLYECATPSERRALLRIFKRLSINNPAQEINELVAA